MSERKSINKYYPPDYDPSKIPKKKKTQGGSATIKVRLETPFSMRCTRCNEYISKSRKFNAKKEFTKEMYLKTKIFRFHITCPRCNNNITFRTSPQTAGFVPETGAVRNYQLTVLVGTEAPETEDEILERLEREEKENKSFKEQREKRKKDPFWQRNSNLKDGDGDLMDNLERKLREQQRQQELTEELEALQARKMELQHAGGDDQAIETTRQRLESELQKLREMIDEAEREEDEEIMQRAFKRFKEEDKREEGENEEKGEGGDKRERENRDDNEKNRSTDPFEGRSAFRQKIVIKRRGKGDGGKLQEGKNLEGIQETESGTKIPTASAKAAPNATTTNSTPLSALAGYLSDSE